MQESAITAERVGVIVLRAGDPIGESDFSGIDPAERSGGGGLIAAINTNGVVGGRAAKPVAPARVTNVGVGSGVDEQLLAVQGAAQFLVEPLLPGQGGRVDGDQRSRVHELFPR